MKKLKTLLSLALVGLLAWMLAAKVISGELRPFTSDGCSAFPNGTLEQNELWLHCCRAHDFAYWKGGSYEQRSVADQKLKACVAEVGEQRIASLMLAGVRVGGTPFLPTPFRWGYGWPYPKMYGELTQQEKAQVKRLMHTR